MWHGGAHCVVPTKAPPRGRLEMPGASCTQETVQLLLFGGWTEWTELDEEAPGVTQVGRLSGKGGQGGCGERATWPTPRGAMPAGFCLQLEW